MLLILNIFGKTDVIEYDGAIYSAIKDSKIPILNQQVEDHINYFVDRLVLADDNMNEYEDSFILLLNNEKLSLEVKQKLILHNIITIEAVGKVQNNEIQNMLYDNNKVKASFDNILYYYNERELSEPDDVLCKFINTNEDSFIKELPKELNSDNLQIIKAILFSPVVNENIAKMIKPLSASGSLG